MKQGSEMKVSSHHDRCTPTLHQRNMPMLVRKICTGTPLHASHASEWAQRKPQTLVRSRAKRMRNADQTSSSPPGGQTRAVIGGIVLGATTVTVFAVVTLRRPHAKSILERMGVSIEGPTAASATTNTAYAEQHHVQAAIQLELLQFKRDLRQEIQQDITNTTTHLLATSFQNHERELTKVLGGPIHTVVTHGETMQSQLRELSHLFVAPQSRGAFGELQLELIVREILPSVAYDFQQTLSNGKRVDCLLRLPSPIGNLAIDSKFPMINNQTTDVDSPIGSGTLTSSAQRRKVLHEKLAKHVNDIATKYIIPGETADSAVLFLPSVSLFLEIVEHHADIVLSAHRSKVWLACPTTLAAVLTTLQGVSRGMAIAKQTQHVTQQIQKLSKDVDLLVTRFEAAEKCVEKTRAELSKMQTSVHKIRKVKLELDALTLSAEGSLPPKLSMALSQPVEDDILLAVVETTRDEYLENANALTDENHEGRAVNGASSS